MNKRILGGVIAVAVAALAVGTWYWRSTQRPVPTATAPEPVPVTPAASAAAPVPAIQHPVAQAPAAPAPASAPEPLPGLDASDGALKSALNELMGTKAVVTMLLTDGFVRRVVATVDNLGRSHASPARWPVQPMAGRFSVERNPDGSEGEVIAAANQARYAAFVRLVESVDVNRAAALYLRMYPLFQQAYEELGYPRGYFNDRLVTVIDMMLATPAPTTPVRVQLTEVKGPVPSERPWVRYEFADPALEAMPAGAKIIARIGEEPARRLKAWLAAFRRAIVR